MGQRIQSISGAVDAFFTLNKDVKTIGIFCADDTWGQAYLNVWTERASAHGVTVEAAVCSTEVSKDFRADVAKMAIKKVDAVIIAYMGDVILRRMKEQRFAPKVLATNNVIEDIKIRKAPLELFEGIFITDWQPSETFLSIFKQKFGRDAVVEAHNSYEALRSLARALKANESDPVHALRGVRYEGVAGTIDFSGSSFANHSVAQLYQVRNGNVERVL